MDSNQLFQFRAIAEAGNITKAANELYITQPALSIALNKLESELDCLLFIREGKKLTLTEDGNKLLKYAVSVTDTITEAERYFRNSERKKVVKLFRIGGINYPLISKGCINYNKFYFNSTLVESDDLRKIAEAGEADIIIADDRRLQGDFKNYEKELLYHQQMLFCVKKDHPLAEKESVCSRDLQNLAIASHSNPYGFESWMKEIKRLNRIHLGEETNLNFTTWCTDIKNFQLPFFMNNFGVSTVWEVVRGFKLIPVEGEYTERDIYMWYKKSRKEEILPVIDTIRHNVEYVVEGDKNFFK